MIEDVDIYAYILIYYPRGVVAHGLKMPRRVVLSSVDCSHPAKLGLLILSFNTVKKYHNVSAAYTLYF